MKKTVYALAAVLAMASGVSLVSCSDDDNELPTPPEVTGSKVPRPAEVFPAGVPSAVGQAAVTKDASGRVTSIVGGGRTISFLYGADGTQSGRSADYDVLMTVREPGDVEQYYMRLNGSGYVEYVLEMDADDGRPSADEWWFGYNADGQLNHMKRTEGGNEVTEIEYAGGDIVSVTQKSGRETDKHIISYTDTKVTSPMENKGCVMLFDECFGVDIDEMEMAYFAGLLGKAGKHLPVRCDEVGDNEYDTFEWTLNAAGMPTVVKSIEWSPSYPSGSYSSVLTFTW